MDFDARISRRKFLVFTLTFYGLVAVLVFYAYIVGVESESSSGAIRLVGLIMQVLYLVFAVRPRLHDMGRTGWWGLGMFVPLLNLVLLLALLFTKGEETPNRYGRKP